MLTHTNSMLTLGVLALAAGCAPDAENGHDDNPPGEQPGQTSRTVSGSVMSEAAALHSEGSLSSATEVTLYTMDEGEEPSVTHGSASIEADGFFTFEATDMDNRDRYVLFATDADGMVLGSLAFDGEASGDDHVIDAKTSVSAEIQVSASAEGEGIGDDAWLDALVTTDVVAEIQAADDAGADVDAMFQVLARSASTADDARAGYAAEAGLDFSAIAAASHDAQGSTTADWAASLDASLEGEGLTAMERTELAATSGAALRATLEHARDGMTSSTEAVLDVMAETALAAEAHAAAASTAAEDAEAGAEAALMAAISASLEASAQAATAGDAFSDVFSDLEAELDTAITTALDVTLPGLASVSADLDALLELDGSGTTDLDRRDALLEWMSEVRADFAAEVAAAAESDGEGSAEAILQAEVDARAEIEAVVDAMGESVDKDLWVHALLSVTVTASSSVSSSAGA